MDPTLIEPFGSNPNHMTLKMVEPNQALTRHLNNDWSHSRSDKLKNLTSLFLFCMNKIKIPIFPF